MVKFSAIFLPESFYEMFKKRIDFLKFSISYLFSAQNMASFRYFFCQKITLFLF